MTSTINALESTPIRGPTPKRNMPVRWAPKQIDQLSRVHLSSLLGRAIMTNRQYCRQARRVGDEPSQQQTLASALRQR